MYMYTRRRINYFVLGSWSKFILLINNENSLTPADCAFDCVVCSSSHITFLSCLIVGFSSTVLQMWSKDLQVWILSVALKCKHRGDNVVLQLKFILCKWIAGAWIWHW
jgi:hypothetical protein